MKRVKVKLGLLVAALLSISNTSALAWSSGEIALLQVGGSTADVVNSSAVDSNGNIYLTGSFSGTVDFDPSSATNSLSSPGISNAYLLKLDSRGNFIWVKHFSGSYTGVGNALRIDSTGNVYVVGDFQNTVDFDPNSGISELTASGSYDAFVVKLSGAGEHIWSAKFGSTSEDLGNSISINTSGGLYVSGKFAGTVDFDPSTGVETITASSNDNFLLKLGLDGSFIWAKKFGGTGGEYNSYIASNSDAVYITGSFQGTNVDFNPGADVFSMSSAGNPDVYIAKLRSDGDFLWAKRFGAANADYSRSITLDTLGNVLVTGQFQLSPDFDPGSETVTVSSNGEYDIFIEKLDSSGNFIWSKHLGGTGTDDGLGIGTDSDSNIYMTGYFANSIDINPGAEIETITSAGSSDIALLKLNSSGSYLWGHRLGGSGDDKGKSVEFNGSDSLHFTGSFSSSIDFDISSGVATISSAGAADGYLLKTYLSGVNFPAVITSPKSAEQISKEAREAREKAVREAQDVVKNELARGGVITVEQFAAADLRGVTVKNVDLINSEISKLPKSESGVISAVAKIVFKYEVAGRVEGKGTIFYSELAAAGLAPESSSYKTMIVRDLKKLSGSDLSTIAQIQSAIQVIEAKYKERKAKLSAVVERIATRSVK